MSKGYGYGPTYYLSLYKTTQRPKKCNRCGQTAYYNHPDLGWLCAPHLTDLVNVGGEKWNWDDYPEMWGRMEALLKRSTTAPAMDATKTEKNVTKPERLDG